MNWFEIYSAYPLLKQLREQRFVASQSDLQKLVEILFQPVKYMSKENVHGLTIDFSSCTVEWAWERYWSVRTPSEIDAVIASWVPLFNVVQSVGRKA